MVEKARDVVDWYIIHIIAGHVFSVIEDTSNTILQRFGLFNSSLSPSLRILLGSIGDTYTLQTAPLATITQDGLMLSFNVEENLNNLITDWSDNISRDYQDNGKRNIMIPVNELADFLGYFKVSITSLYEENRLPYFHHEQEQPHTRRCAIQ